jgi:5-methylcytosine-specific restriction enzyme A
MATRDQRYHAVGWAPLRLHILDRDHWQCQIRERGCTHVATDADHIVAVADGGEFWDPSNLRAACKACNARLGAAVARRRRARYATTDAVYWGRW